MAQTGYLAEIQIGRAGKIDDKGDEARPTYCGSEPKPPRPEIGADESDNPEIKKEDGKVRPLHGSADFVARLRMHDRQLSESGAGHSECGEGEE